MKKFGLIVCCLGILIFSGCTRRDRPVSVLDGPFGRIGKKTYTIADLTAFSSMRYYHPVRSMEGRFPGNRSTTTLFIETQVLYPEAQAYRKQVTNGADWKWKELYLAGHFYQVGIIDRNMGASDEEILEFYRRNRTELAAEFGIGEGDTVLDIQARISVVRRLFLDRYPPSAEFAANNSGITRRELESKWFEQTVNDREAFFRDTYYRKRFGKDFPRDNARSELVGSGKLISETELKAVMAWIGKGQTVSENLVVSKMVAWNLFSEEARRIGFTRDESFRKTREQFERFEIVRFYANEVLEKMVEVDFLPNRDFIRYAIADRNRRPTLNIDREELVNFSDSLRTVMHEANIIEYIHQRRARTGVHLMQSDYVDMFIKTPAQLKHEADSLAASQNIERAKRIYSDLNEWFLYSVEGRNAFLELAKLHTDARAYTNAISAYRNFLLYGGEDSEWCRIFFTIGYIYAEHLENYPFAAMNYRWILKNQPDCALATDTEFMYLNLGEPMVEIEELRQMSIRQGREW